MRVSSVVRRRPARRRGGFTLMEVLLVLAILVLLGSLVVVSFANIMGDADSKNARLQISTLEQACGVYLTHVKRYPSSLEALRNPPADLPNPARWKGPYLDKEIPLDPWDNPYQYSVNGNQIRIWSLGPDGVDGTADDIDNYQQG